MQIQGPNKNKRDLNHRTLSFNTQESTLQSKTELIQNKIQYLTTTTCQVRAKSIAAEKVQLQRCKHSNQSTYQLQIKMNNQEKIQNDTTLQEQYLPIQPQLQPIMKYPQVKNNELQSSDLLPICQILNIIKQKILQKQIHKDTNIYQQKKSQEKQLENSSLKELLKNSRNITNKSLVQDIDLLITEIQFSEDQSEDDLLWQTIDKKNDCE